MAPCKPEQNTAPGYYCFNFEGIIRSPSGPEHLGALNEEVHKIPPHPGADSQHAIAAVYRAPDLRTEPLAFQPTLCFMGLFRWIFLLLSAHAIPDGTLRYSVRLDSMQCAIVNGHCLDQ
jgi:hypothetical protein